MPVPVPLRSSTFILSNDPGLGNTEVERLSKTNSLNLVWSNTFIVDKEDGTSTEIGKSDQKPQFELPKRSNTFTVDEKDGSTSKKSSLRFSMVPDMEKKSCLNLSSKGGTSIGKRIMLSSMKKGNVKQINKENSGSTIKKTNKTNPSGSIMKKKFSATKQMPNFKALHKKLFENMESISDNKKRKLERAEELIQSPIVPKCAIFSKSASKNGKGPSKIGVAYPNVRTPVEVSPLAKKLVTPVAVRQMTTSTANRFGFKRLVKKEEASDMIKKKQPAPMHKKTESERKILQGVRVNKRFMLQMKMRQQEK